MTQARITPDRSIQAFGGDRPGTFQMTAALLRTHPLALTVGERTIAAQDVEAIYRCAQSPGRRAAACEKLGRALGLEEPARAADLVDFLRLLDDAIVGEPSPGSTHPAGTVVNAQFGSDVLQCLTDGRESYGSPGAAPLDAAFTATAGGLAVRRAPDRSQNLLLRAFKRGDHVYSQNFGILDRAHITHNANLYVCVYREALEALRRTPPQTVVVPAVMGSGRTLFPTAYTLTPPRPRPGETAEDVAHRLAREIVSNAGVRYEEHTSLFGVNALIPGDVGKSSFSTEDLPSNALGMEAAAAYLRGDGVRPGESLDAFALRWATTRGGTLYALNDSDDPSQRGVQLERRSFGNETFRPFYAASGPRPERDPELYAFFETLEAIRQEQANIDVSEPDAARGWFLSDEGPSLATGVAASLFL